MAAVFFSALGVGCLVWGLVLKLRRFSRRSLLIRLYGTDRSVEPLPPGMARLSHALRRIPLTRHMAPQAFRTLQWWLAVAGLAILSVPPLVTGAQPRWPLLLLYPPLLALLPELWLRLQLHRRRHVISRCYPDLLAHLVMQTEAGASTLQALQTAPPVVREPLRSELEDLLSDLQVAPLPAALRRFAERTGAPDIASFAENLIYHQSRGIGLKEVLADEEAHVLAMARQATRRRIQASSVTMAVVTVILLLNGMMIYFTPVAYELLRLLSRAG